jgi:hypothetical protein
VTAVLQQHLLSLAPALTRQPISSELPACHSYTLESVFEDSTCDIMSSQINAALLQDFKNILYGRVHVNIDKQNVKY